MVTTSQKRRVRSVSVETYKPLTPRVPVGPDGPRPMSHADIANVTHLDGSELVRFRVVKGGVQ